MPKVTLTDKLLPTLRGDGRREVNFNDDRLAGFTLRITAAGARVFVLRYSFEGKQRRLRLGSVEKMTAKEARKKATSALEGLRRGIDPQAEKVQQAGVWTCAALIDKYMAELDRRLAHGDIAKSTFIQHEGLIRRVE